MEMMQYQLARLPYQDSLKALEADIHRANALHIKTGDQNHLLIEGRQPSGTSMRLHDSLDKLEISEEELSSIACSSSGNKIVEGDGRLVNVDLEREDECGICLEPCTKVVLPHCCHAMCIKCYGKWNTQSESCPFRLGILRRVNSEDLWVLTCNEDVVDAETVSKEDLMRFYIYISSLPKDDTGCTVLNVL